jgi:hypothetical protein
VPCDCSVEPFLAGAPRFLDGTNLSDSKMQKTELQYATMRVAGSMDLRGRVAADETNRGLRVEKRSRSLGRIACYGLFGLAVTLLPMTQALADADDMGPFVPLQVSTVPANGDQNPYGVAFVPPGFSARGPLQPGDVLVSNFNNAGTPPTGNLQGTGTTIVRVTPAGQVSLFFNGNPNNKPPPTLGLTTALGVLKRGFVLVGNVPTADGTFGTLQSGSLLVLDHNGNRIATLTQLLNSPWDLTIQDGFYWARVFVSNVRSGTVTRLDLDVDPGGVVVKQATQIASGYTSHSDPAALIVGPTGLAYDANADVLFVASTADNEIFAVPHAGTATHSNGRGTVIYQDNAHLRGPLALAFAPNGDLLTSNGDAPTVSAPTGPSTQTLNSEIVEFTKSGKFIAEFSIDSALGAAFGIATAGAGEDSTRLAAVDDATNEVTVFRLSTP